MNEYRELLKLFDIPLITLGSEQITAWMLIQIVALTVALVYLSGKMRRWVAEQMLARTSMEVGGRQAIAALVRYLILTIGLVIILQTAGIDLTAFNVLAGAVGIGLGFGLQNIVNNFISGLIILFERPIKVGDRIVVGEVEGDVVHIGGRSTTVITNDNIAIIVPNAKFVTENVINWSHSERKVRFRIPVTVAYGSDVQLVQRLLLEAATECPDVLKEPPPGVRLMEFGTNGLSFELRAWSTTLIHRGGLFVSTLNLTIYRKFTEHGIEIPYPQRDLHIREGCPVEKKAETDSVAER